MNNFCLVVESDFKLFSASTVGVDRLKSGKVISSRGRAETAKEPRSIQVIPLEFVGQRLTSRGDDAIKRDFSRRYSMRTKDEVVGVHAERVKESRANEENLLMTMSGSVGCSTEEKQRQQPPLRLSYHVSNMLLFFRRLLCGQIDEN